VVARHASTNHPEVPKYFFKIRNFLYSTCFAYTHFESFLSSSELVTAFGGNLQTAMVLGSVLDAETSSA